jgi:peptide/nickel transport system substrate-binding protein
MVTGMQRAPLIHDPRFSRRQFLGMTAAGVAGGALAGTGLTAPAAFAAGTPKRGGVLHLGHYGDVIGFDGPKVTDNPSIWTMLLVYDQLVRPTVDGLNLEPSLAQSWEVSPDGKTYTFHLRRGVKFHDGSPMTAADVKFSIDRAVFGKGSQSSFLFGALKRMEVVDQYTVRAHLSAPHSPFLSDMAYYGASVLPKKLVQSMGDKFFQHPIGTGPFMFKSWAKGSEIVMVRNPHHFRAPRPYVDEYHQMVIPEANTRVLQVQSGALDIALFVPPAAASSLRSNPNVTLHVDNFFDSHFICIQTRSIPPLGDKLVRQAMNYAIDKDAIVKHFLFGFGEPSGQAIPKMFGYSQGVHPYPFDMANAKALMAKSKFPKGFATSVYVTASFATPDKQIAEYVQQQLRQLNIKLSIEVLDDATFDAKIFGPNYQMNVSYMTSDIVDPDELMSYAVVPAGGTDAVWTYYKSPTVDKLGVEAAGAPDRAVRQRLYDQINATQHEEAPMIFLYHQPSLSVTSSKLQGFKVLTTGNYRLEKCWFSS